MKIERRMSRMLRNNTTEYIMKNVIIAVSVILIVAAGVMEAVTTNTISATAFATITIPAACSNDTAVYFSQPNGATAVWVTAKSVAGSILIEGATKSASLQIDGVTNYSLTKWTTVAATSTLSFIAPSGKFNVKNSSGAAQVIDIGF